MAQKNRCYRVQSIGSGYKDSYPLRDVKPGTVVKAMEYAPQGSLDVVDVKLKTGQTENVYSFQLEKAIKCPICLRKRK